MLAALWSNDLFFIFLRISVSLYSWTIQKAYLSSTFYSWYFAVGFVIRGGKSWSLWKCWPKLPKCLCRLDQRAGSVRPGREADASPHIWVCFFSWILLSIIYLYSLSLLSFLVSIGRPMHLLISAVCIFSWILLFINIYLFIIVVIISIIYREAGVSPRIFSCSFYICLKAVALSSVLNFFVVKKITTSNINIIITLNKYFFDWMSNVKTAAYHKNVFVFQARRANYYVQKWAYTAHRAVYTLRQQL